jgi:DNA-directed RNA polymerase alpha subunit
MLNRNTDIELLGLPVRLENLLKISGITQLGELMDKSEYELEEMLKSMVFSRNRLNEYKEILRKFRLTPGRRNGSGYGFAREMDEILKYEQY